MINDGEMFRQDLTVAFISGEITVKTGQYSYEFSCILPVGLPTSLEAEYGHIRYRAKVVIDHPTWEDEMCEEMFTVIKPLNLNLEPSLKV